MKLNIELKYNVPDPGLAPAVIELLRREQFLDDVVITSLDYAALKQVEGIEPRLRHGPHRHRVGRQRAADRGRLPQPQLGAGVGPLPGAACASGPARKCTSGR